MKVVFLDFDGPIIPIMSHRPLRRDLQNKAWPPCIEQLNRITDSTGAKIVVSSTWRWGGEDHVRNLLKQWGVRAEVIGITPILEDSHGGLSIATERGHEIGAWLTSNPAVKQFVILDDNDDMGSLRRYLIQTPFETGITAEHADAAIAMLKKSE